MHESPYSKGTLGTPLPDSVVESFALTGAKEISKIKSCIFIYEAAFAAFFILKIYIEVKTCS